ncbi:hypothetical protein AcV5_008450 [Taiwanofungus camphoratus]|nr:hypothetical protein AcV5_008450 [Antrodia cinnamomea]
MTVLATDNTTSTEYASPDSEQSVYFDAPIMIFNSKNDPDNHSARSQSRLGSAPTQDVDQPVNAAGADIDDQPAVLVAPDPIASRFHEHTETEYGEDQDHGRKASTSTPSDSGYDSTRGRQRERSRSRSSRLSANMKPIPVLWADSHDTPQPSPQPSWLRNLNLDGDSVKKRAASLRSFRTWTDNDRGDRDSVRTTPVGSRFSADRRRRVSLSGGAFASGAGMVGPAATPKLDNGFQNRTTNAEAGLTPRQLSRIKKAEVKEGKRVAKIIKSEAKAEKKALEDATKELADIQKMQRTAVKEESKAYNAHAKVLRTFHREELEFFAARAKYERAQADLQAHEDAREAARSHAREITEMLQEKNREVEWLRAQKVVDDREREAKLRQLSGKP